MYSRAAASSSLADISVLNIKIIYVACSRWHWTSWTCWVWCMWSCGWAKRMTNTLRPGKTAGKSITSYKKSSQKHSNPNVQNSKLITCNQERWHCDLKMPQGSWSRVVKEVEGIEKEYCLRVGQVYTLTDCIILSLTSRVCISYGLSSGHSNNYLFTRVM